MLCVFTVMNWAVLLEDSLRSSHPVYSFPVWLDTRCMIELVEMFVLFLSQIWWCDLEDVSAVWSCSGCSLGFIQSRCQKVCFVIVR